MGANLSRWQKRVISGLILAPIVICAVWKGGPMFAAMVAAFALVALREWYFLAAKTRNAVLFTALGLFYIGISFWCCYLIREHHSVKIAVLFLTMVWASDISAYIFGKMIGGPRMSPAISPNKTWAGLAGATILPGLVGVVYILIYNAIYEYAVFPYDLYKLVLVYLAMGAVIGFVGQAGDLLVSAFKRRAQVKDAGDLIPGHGGVIDGGQAGGQPRPAGVVAIFVPPAVFQEEDAVFNLPMLTHPG